jgi:1-phosphofructokinase family hexose kinase
MRGTGSGRIVFVAANPSIDRLYEIDRLESGRIHRPDLVVAVAGGKGLNAARAAATLGGRVTVAGIVGGRAGDWIGERLAELGIEARLVRSAAETRTCISILDRTTGELTEVYERGAAISAGDWEALETIVERELDRGDLQALTVSGSLPPGAPIDGFGRLARRAAAQSVPVIADAYGPALAAVLVERPAIIKINASEAGDATEIAVNDGASAMAAARTLRMKGAASVIVTLGVDGAVVASASEETFLVPPAVRGSWPVGSGDAFLAGLAVALASGSTIVDAARRGLAAGIANSLVPGAGELDPGAIDGILRGISMSSPAS